MRLRTTAHLVHLGAVVQYVVHRLEVEALLYLGVGAYDDVRRT